MQCWRVNIKDGSSTWIHADHIRIEHYHIGTEHEERNDLTRVEFIQTKKRFLRSDLVKLIDYVPLVCVEAIVPVDAAWK